MAIKYSEAMSPITVSLAPLCCNAKEDSGKNMPTAAPTNAPKINIFLKFLTISIRVLILTPP